MKPIKVAKPRRRATEVIVVDEPVLSGWLTYPGNVAAGFRDHLTGRARILGDHAVAPRVPWDGRLWQVHDGEFVVDQGTGEVLKTRIRLRLCWEGGPHGHVVEWSGAGEHAHEQATGRLSIQHEDGTWVPITGLEDIRVDHG